MGGSLGAKSINETIDNNIDVLKKTICSLSGKRVNHMQVLRRKLKKKKVISGPMHLLTGWNMLMRAADVVVARAGAMTIAEILLLVKQQFLFRTLFHQKITRQLMHWPW